MSAEKGLAGPVTNFSFALYKQLLNNNKDGNLIASPLSIYSCVLLAYSGAENHTKAEIEKALHLQSGFNDKSGVLQAFSEIMKVLNPQKQGSDAQYQLAMANSLFVEQSLSLKPQYVKSVEQHFEAKPSTENFRSDSNGARQRINAWVEQVTRNKIQDLLKPGTVDGSTLAVLVNAIYFKADWEKEFDEEQTQDNEFRGFGRKFTVPMMYKSAKMLYARHEAARFQYVELPYKSGELSFCIVLPDDDEGLRQLEKNFTPEVLIEAAKQIRNRKVELSLPRFKMTEEYDLEEPLMNLGMQSLFGRADLSGISETPLKVSKAVHKAFIELNEKGTEAAAATAMVMMRCAMVDMDEPPVVRCDHPFFFAIKHNEKELILFVGRVAQFQ